MIIAQRLVRHRLFLIGIFALAIILRLLFFKFSGYKLLTDDPFYVYDSSFYLKSANYLIGNNLNFLVLIQNKVSISYWLYPYFLVLAKLIPLPNLYFTIVILQIIVESMIVLVIYKISELIFDRTTAMVAAFIYALSWEVFRWDIHVLTEPLYIFIMSLSMLFVYKVFYDNEHKRRVWVVNGILFVLLILCRPTFFPYLVAALLFIILYKLNDNKKALVFIPLLAVSLIAIFIIVRIGTNNSEGLSNILDLYNSKTHIGTLFRQGIVVHETSEFDYKAIINWDYADIMQKISYSINLFIRRMGAYWYIYVGDFSNGHLILNLVYFLPMFIFSISGVVMAIRRKMFKDLSFLLMIIVFHCLFHALTEVDHNWRYRLPVLPSMIILEAYGISNSLKWLYNYLLMRHNKTRELG